MQSGPENFKKSKPNKSISRKKNFAISKMAKKQFLNWEKVKTSKKKFFFYLFDFTRVFLPGF